MSILQTRSGQRGVSMWSMSGSLLLVAGMAGLGVALIKPGSPTASIAPVATGNRAAAPLTGADTKTSVPGGTKPALSSVTKSPEPGDSKSAAPGPAKSTAPGTASTEVTKADPPGSGPHPNWHGTWRGGTPAVEMVITATRVGECKWVNATEPRFDGECEAGYAKSSLSLANLVRRFEESVALFQRDPSDFSITDPAQSRKLISRIKPGNYRVIWMQDGSDCGMGDLIVDGDSMLRVVDCKYRHQISLFTRVR